MICFPNCKINIGLYVTGKRADGYHNIETIFCPIGLNDVLEAVRGAKTGLTNSGLVITGSNEDNLVMKAYQLLSEKFPDKIPHLKIFLHKVIPSGAGLGGGSADGAFMLRLINDYCQLGLDNNILSEMALQLGSDCPFFIYNRPMFATGRGEQMKEVTLDLSAYSIQLVYAHVPVSTKEAFGMIVPKAATYHLMDIAALPISEWRGTICNDFETPVFNKHTELAIIKEQLYAGGAIYASMSGSGSAVYGIMPKGKKATIEIGMGFDNWLL